MRTIVWVGLLAVTFGAGAPGATAQPGAAAQAASGPITPTPRALRHLGAYVASAPRG